LTLFFTQKKYFHHSHYSHANKFWTPGHQSSWSRSILGNSCRFLPCWSDNSY
jgi:hypothetical protein